MSRERIADLLDSHRVFAEVLTALRADAHGRRLEAARVRLDWLTAALSAHIAFEEDVLMPIFEPLDHPVANGRPEVFIRDHRLIQELLAEADAALAADAPVALADALAQLDGVLEHHDLREERYFKGRLDDHLGARAAALVEGIPEAVAPEVGSEPVAPAPPEATGIDGVRWAVAVGRLDLARAALEAVDRPRGPKVERLRDRLDRALGGDDPMAAQEALRLYRAARLGAAPI